MAIVVAGPMANFVFAIVALAILFATVGRPFTPAEVGDGPAGQPGGGRRPRAGDRITAVDGTPIESFEELQAIVRDSAGRPLRSCIDRDGETMELTVTPSTQRDRDRFGNVHQVGLIGVSRAGRRVSRAATRSSPCSRRRRETGRMIGGTLYALGEMVVGNRGTQELGGPLRIAQMSGEIAQDGFVPALVVHGGAVDQSRPDQPVPDPDAGRRPSADVRRSRRCAAGRSTSAARRSPSASGWPWCSA